MTSSESSVQDFINSCHQVNADKIKELKSQNEDLFKLLINQALVHCEGGSLLHYSLIKNSTETMRFLIENGFDVNFKDKFFRTPLHVAVTKNNREAVLTMLNKGALLNERDIFGNNPLHYSLKFHFFDIAQDLLLFNADINSKRENGCSSLHDSMSSGDEQTLKFILSCPKLLVNTKDILGETPLHKGVINGHADCIKLLLSIDTVQVLLTNSKKQNVLHLAALNDRPSVVGLFKKSKWRSLIDEFDDFTQTPLHYSAEKNFVDCTRELLKFKPNSDLKNRKGNTAIMIAIKHLKVNRNYEKIYRLFTVEEEKKYIEALIREDSNATGNSGNNSSNSNSAVASNSSSPLTNADNTAISALTSCLPGGSRPKRRSFLESLIPGVASLSFEQQQQDAYEKGRSIIAQSMLQSAILDLQNATSEQKTTQLTAMEFITEPNFEKYSSFDIFKGFFDKFQKAVVLKDRTIMLKSFKNCFLGSEAIDWMVQTFGLGRKEARCILRWFNDRNLIVHINGSTADIEDSTSSFYQIQTALIPFCFHPMLKGGPIQYCDEQGNFIPVELRMYENGIGIFQKQQLLRCLSISPLDFTVILPGQDCNDFMIHATQAALFRSNQKKDWLNSFSIISRVVDLSLLPTLTEENYKTLDQKVLELLFFESYLKLKSPMGTFSGGEFLASLKTPCVKNFAQAIGKRFLSLGILYCSSSMDSPVDGSIREDFKDAIYQYQHLIASICFSPVIRETQFEGKRMVLHQNGYIMFKKDGSIDDYEKLSPTTIFNVQKLSFSSYFKTEINKILETGESKKISFESEHERNEWLKDIAKICNVHIGSRTGDGRFTSLDDDL